ncbi:MAG: hypothetical protein QXT53_01890 [Ignisphaera sp.]
MSECTNTVSTYDLEGYAMAGLVMESKYVSCGKGKERIIVKLADGRTVCSECTETKFIETAKRVVELYKAFRLLQK